MSKNTDRVPGHWADKVLKKHARRKFKTAPARLAYERHLSLHAALARETGFDWKVER